MEEESLTGKLKDKFIGVGLFIALLYVIYVLDLFLPLNEFGIRPRIFEGLFGILFSPFLHGDILHLISNTVPLFILTLVLVVFYEKKAIIVISFIILVGGLGVWIFARSANHIGASGLVYGLASFLIAYGFITKNLNSLLISLVIVIMYGGLIFGVFPTRFWISWEGHLFGALAGVTIAFLLKGTSKKKINE